MIRPISLVFAILLASPVFAQNSKEPQPLFPKLKEFPNVRDIALSQNGNEAYFTVQSLLEETSVILRITKLQDQWQTPMIASFSGRFKDIEPFLSPDNLRLYFASNRPLVEQTGVPKDFDIWYVARSAINEPWGEPVNIGPPVNSEGDEFYPAVANSGNMYFTSTGAGTKGLDDIFFSEWDGKSYLKPVSMDSTINTEGYEYNAYVDANESLIIFGSYNRKDGFGSGDIYLSRKTSEGWSRATNMGEFVNSKFMDYCPYVDFNTMTLYFTSRRSSIKPVNNFTTIEDILEETGKYENGFSRLYKVSIQLKN